MTDIYDRARATAAHMLAPRSSGGKGLAITLSVVTEGEYDPATGTSPVTTTSYTGSALRDTYSRHDIDGTRIKQDDVKFLVSPTLLNGQSTPMIDPQYTLTFDGTTYTVISVVPWNYAGLTCGYEVQGRK